MKGKLKQILSFLLVLLFFVSLLPSAIAEEELPEAVTEEPETPAEEPEAGEPAEQPAPEKELPEGIAGMPKDYVMSEATIAEKQSLAEHDVLTTLEDLTSGKDYAENEVLVSAASEEEAKTIAAAYNAELVRFNGHFAVLRLTTVSVRDAVAAGMDLQLALPPVEPNYIIHLDPTEYGPAEFPDVSADGVAVPSRQSWQTWMSRLDNPDVFIKNPSGDYQYMHDMVNSYEAWGVTRSYPWIKVAVIDTGVDYNHEDLQGKVLSGYDFVDDDSDPMDEHGHGTHCSGIIAATLGNGVGGAGIAPEASILPVRVLDAGGSGETSWICDGIYYAADQGAQIISMSLGSLWFSYVEQEAVTYANNKNVTVIAAMGNDGTNVKSYPAAYSGVIAVAAVNPSGGRAPYSNFGSWCDIAAPGSDIWSTTPGNNYECWDGTSMATPVVAGAAALYLDHMDYNPGPKQVEKALLGAVTPCKSQGCGKGIIDAAKLVGSNGTLYFDVYDYLYDEGYIGSSYDLNHISISSNNYIYFWSSTWDDSFQVVYTVDGSAPSVVNGEVKNGIASRYLFLENYNFKVGDRVTIKALYVSGLGAVSKISAWSFTLAPETAEAVLDGIAITIQSPKALISGKSVVLTASVESTEYGDVDQHVTWKITANSGCPNAKIDAKTGKLTTKAGETGSVTVRATSSANKGKYKSVKIPVKQILPITSMTLYQSAAKSYVGANEFVYVGSLIDSQKNSVAPSSRAYRWTSSNPKIAYVRPVSGNTEDCEIFCVGKGTVTITCEVLDGSGKKASVKINVVQPVTEVAITSGPSYIAAGASAGYKAAVYPTTANDKKVVWSLSGAPSGVTVAANGTVKVPSYVTSGSFYLVAKSNDGIYSSAKATKKITIVSSKTDWVHITSYSSFSGASNMIKKDNNGCITAVTLYSANTANHNGAENTIKLVAKTTNNTKLIWQSSNTKVATVDPNTGFVTAKSAGNTNITCIAQDGSNKKATCKITVVNPVSSIFVQSRNAGYLQSDDTFLIGIGKTVGNVAVMGDAYGKPSNTKVSWSFLVYKESYDGTRTGITSTCKSNNWVRVAANGNLTVDQKILSTWRNAAYDDNQIVIYLTATAQDGTNVKGTARYIVSPAIEQLKATRTTLTLSRSYGEDLSYDFFYVYVARGGLEYTGLDDFIITSSNPEIATAVLNGYVDYDEIEIAVLAGTKTGTTRITIKANDGSNKSITVTIKVVN